MFSNRIKTALDATKADSKKFADEANWAFGRRSARGLGVVAPLAVVVAILLVLLNWYVAPTEPGDKKARWAESTASNGSTGSLPRGLTTPLSWKSLRLTFGRTPVGIAGDFSTPTSSANEAAEQDKVGVEQDAEPTLRGFPLICG